MTFEEGIHYAKERARHFIGEPDVSFADIQDYGPILVYSNTDWQEFDEHIGSLMEQGCTLRKKEKVMIGAIGLWVGVLTRTEPHALFLTTTAGF